MFLETSALTGENVEEAFLKCSRTILGKIETGKLVAGTLCCSGLIALSFMRFRFISQFELLQWFVIREILRLLELIFLSLKEYT